MLPHEWKYQPALLQQRARAAASSDLRERIRFDLEGRAPYAWGMLAATDAARFFGFAEITVIEFGVAAGNGLFEMCRLASLIGDLTKVRIHVTGFDNCIGLPAPENFRDHPELWSAGDFAMGDAEPLRRKLPSDCRLVIGDIADTLGGFLANLDKRAPIGFCAVDTDLYSSSVSAFKIYTGDPLLYLPVGIAYCDDTLGGASRIGSLLRNRKAGQLLALEEFNTRHEHRIIDEIRTLKYRRPLFHEQWIEQVFAVHILDHPARNKQKREASYSMQEHGSVDWLGWPD